MGPEVTLHQALEQAQSSSIKERSDGVKNIQHVLSHNQKSSNVDFLGKLSWHRIYEVLFDLAVSEQSTWLKAKTATTRSSADTRLSSISSALRSAVNVGTPSVRLKTIRALIDHVVQVLPLSNGGICNPLALDYAKCLRVALSFQSHVEHLQQEDWERAATFCVEIVRHCEAEMADEDTVSGADMSFTAGTINSASYRSSRSHYKESAGSQGTRSMFKQVSEELVGCLFLLTAAPNAPIVSRAPVLLSLVIDFLGANAAIGPSHQKAFAAINNILHHTFTENITLTRESTSPLIRLVRHFWSQKSTGPKNSVGIKEDMLSTLLYLRPYMISLMRLDDASTLRMELGGLLDVLRNEYGRRLDREQLHLDELNLEVYGPHPRGADCRIRTAIFGLRCIDLRAEASWTVISMVATLCELLGDDRGRQASADEEDDEGVTTRPRKRQRRGDDFDDVLSATGEGMATSRVCALQTITFVAQQATVSPIQAAKTVDRLLASCSEDNGTIASWALLGLASCASQTTSASPTMAVKWSAVWQMGTRAMSNASTCRAACHLLSLLIQLQLVVSASVTELIQGFVSSMDLNGPAILVDSVLRLLHVLLQRAQQLRPAAVNTLAEAFVITFCQWFSPSKFGEKSYAANNYLYGPSDVLALLNACLGHGGHQFGDGGFPVWKPVAQTWLVCQKQHELIAYLLLLPKEDPWVCETLCNETQAQQTAAAAARLPCESTLLNHLVSELQKVSDTWNQWSHERPRSISLDMFRSLCNDCCILSCMLQCRAFRDTRRHSQAQRQLTELWTSLTRFVTSSNCSQDMVDSLLVAVSRMCKAPAWCEQIDAFASPECEKLICREVRQALSVRRHRRDTTVDDEDEDRMDMDEVYDSQNSRGGKMMSELHELGSDHSTAFSIAAMRSNVDLHATLAVALDDELRSSISEGGTASSCVVDHIIALPEASVLASRKTLSMLPQLGLTLNPTDAERLLDYCTETFLSSDLYERSEVAIGTILEVVLSLTPAWTNAENQSLYNLGIDMYEWYMHAFSKKVLSANVQKTMGTLLLRLCELNADYGGDSSTESAQSARTSLFQLLKQGCIVAQYHLASGISVIFGLFILSRHEDVFVDLQASLPTDADWIEGLAIRLLILAKLASSWHSLLRRCVYYIFESAGKIKSSLQHAAHCVALLTDCLGFNSAQKLFRLFAPQLLHSWLEHGTVTSLPFAAFQYESLEELLDQNQVEITAQLLMRGKEDGMHAVTNALKISAKDLAKRAFAKSMAYAISQDLSNKLSNGQEAGSEARLRQLTAGTKDEFKKLAVAHFPAIMGQFYLSAQQEGIHEKWLDKHQEYTLAAKNLKDMKGFGESQRTLPGDQQPCFRIKYLPEQIKRLCRRTGNDPSQPWTVSTFALTLRMHLDAIDDALGSLHKSLMLRKLRILICMAGNVALSGYPMEILMNTIIPFLSDSECADDAIGVLRYVLQLGEPRVCHEGVSFAHGSALVVVLRMQEHSITRQDRTTQESQHNLTVQRMETFRQWLVEYLRRCQPPSSGPKASDSHVEAHRKLVEGLETVRLPGNARQGSPESSLLLLLLDQQRELDPLISTPHCAESLRLLTKNFEAPTIASEDCIGADQSSAAYADSLWHIIKRSAVDDGFLLWAIVALGRAYVSTGVRPHASRHSDNLCERKRNEQAEGIPRSYYDIAVRLSELVQSPNRAEAGLADWTMRSAQLTFVEAAEAVAFEQMLPDMLVSATADGTFGYKPPLAAEAAVKSGSRQQLHEALKLAPNISDERWFIQFAVSLCRWAASVPVLPALPALLQNIPGLAIKLLPCMIHIVLSIEIDKAPVLRDEFSKSLAAHLENHDPALLSRRKNLLQTVLYLRGQPYPGEENDADRTQWLEVDLLLAAEAAAHCGLPTAALLFAESIVPVTQTSRRSSSRASVSQLMPVHIPDDLLVFIFKHVEEPDSFYGVQQSASLDSVLEKLDYEGDGLKSLMFRSAQMDSAMRLAHNSSTTDSKGMLHSLSALNLHSLEYALLSAPLVSAGSGGKEMMDAARKLQQWDVGSPDPGVGGAAVAFSAFQELSRASGSSTVETKLRSLLLSHAKVELQSQELTSPSISWCNVLATLAELSETLSSSGDAQLQSCWQKMQQRTSWMQSVKYEDCCPIISSRSTLFSVLAQNGSVSKAMHVGVQTSRMLEAKSLLHVAEFARQHGVLQEALSAAAQANTLAVQCKSLGLNIVATTKMETALVLWRAGEVSTSVQMLRDVERIAAAETQDISIGQSGLLAELAHQLEDARLEKPDHILTKCLQPAIEKLRDRTEGSEAGKVFHQFAIFCDRQLQNTTELEDFNRLVKLRTKRQEEVRELDRLLKSKSKTDYDFTDTYKEFARVKKWYELDNAEYQRLHQSRQSYMQQSLQNYLLTLHASDDHDDCALRFFSLWLENASEIAADTVASKHLPDVPSWKFVVLLNQLMSRLGNDNSVFQTSLKALVKRICGEHPYHALHHLYAATRQPENHSDVAAVSRFRAAETIASSLMGDKSRGRLVRHTFAADDEYTKFAQSDKKGLATRGEVRNFQPAVHMTERVIKLAVAPATITLSLRPDGEYTSVPIISKWRPELLLLNGNSHPKALTALGDNGTSYKQLFKADDDLRQDAIMEQVFEEVSKMLRNHKAARQRNLQVRTYKVVPLEPMTGILEWVPNSIPIGDWVKPAHRRYYPQSMKPDVAFNTIRDVSARSLGTRVKEYRKVCEQLPPVMRHFFFEHFNDPDEWFEKRTAYTRTTATISILGHVLGLGDRHCQNILLDEKSGEAVHIDLGIAFEGGRVLPIPETVPFRLSRDIVDGMGVTKTEGVFRRCCEFTLDALREDKDSIMTLLDVLRYDPLYKWSVSPLRAKKMQDAQETGRDVRGRGEEVGSKEKEQDLGEAARALSVVEKKLSKTLSTAATISELIQQATEEKNLATLFAGWSAYF